MAAARYPAVKTFRTLEELLADKNIELVIVNTPNYTHFDFVRKALEAAKHVVVEKPFTIASREGEELIAFAEKQGVVLSVYQNRRYDSDYRTVKKVVKEKLTGEVVEAEFHYDRYSQQLSPKLHKETPGPGTGSLYDLGSHLIDQALQLFGTPDAVFADLRILRPVSSVIDYFELLLYYESLRVRLHSSYLVKEPLPAYIIHGTKGSFIKSKTDIQEAALQAGTKPGGDGWGMEPEHEKGLLHSGINDQVRREFIPSLKGNYGDFYTELYNCIRNGQPPPVTATEGLMVIKIIEAAVRSNEERKVIKLNIEY